MAQKWAKNGPKMVQLLSHLFIFASTQPLNFRGRMGRRTSTVHRERTEKRVFGANFFLWPWEFLVKHFDQHGVAPLDQF